MHLRRALLLFAIVLGLAALASSVSRPRDARSPAGGSPADQPAPASPRPAPEPVRLGFNSSGPPRRRRLDPGRPAVVTVRTEVAGQVELEGLGLSAPADPLTPARFDVLAAQPVRAKVLLTPAGARDSEVVGTLSVSSPGPARAGPARSGGPPATRTAPGR